MNRPFHLSAWSAFAFACVNTSAQAAYVLYDSGDLTQAELGFVINPPDTAWDSPATILTYAVSLDTRGDLNPANDTWLYAYTFTVPSKEVSHVLIETSPGITLLAGTTTSGREGPGIFGTQGNSNPGIPGDLFGLKFNLSGLSVSWQIETDRAPMWGDFYAKDGKTAGSDVYAYNVNFGQPAPGYVQGVEAFGFALVPDTTTGGPNPVPVPAALWLLGSVLGLVPAVSRQRSA